MKLRKSIKGAFANMAPVLILLVIPAAAWGNQRQKKNTFPPVRTARAASRPRVQQRSQQKPMYRGRQQVQYTRQQGQRGPHQTSHSGVHGGGFVKGTTAGPGGAISNNSLGRGNRFGGGTRAGATVRSFRLPGGKTAAVRFRRNGRVATIHANGLTIRQPLHGPRTTIAERNGHMIVTTGPHRGYVQRAFVVRGGIKYYQRTTIINNVSHVSVYRGFSYRGHAYYGYVPAYYYRPVYYGWAYDPWPAPVYWGPAAWGWARSPWWGFYGAYWSPYPVYATASLWLTDYLIAANLQAAYQAQAEANAAADQAQANANAPADQGQPEVNTPEGQAQPDVNAQGNQGQGDQTQGNAGPPPQPGAQPSASQTQLSPQVKEMIAAEVKEQLAAERTAAANPQQAPTSGDQAPDALNPAERVFVVSTSLDVKPVNAGEQCSLTPGDVVMRLTDTPDENQNVTASVQSSKSKDCATGTTVAVGVPDLQEMHNNFRQQLDSGLKTLAANSGKGGLPKAPDTNTSSGVVPTPVPDADAANELQDQDLQANRTEQEVQQAGG